MERRSFLIGLAALGLLPAAAFAKPAMAADFRMAELGGGEFAMRTSRVALAKTTNPDIVQFANAEIAEQLNVATALGSWPGMAPLRSDQAQMLSQLEAMPAGPGFNAMYVKGQIRGHRELLALNSSYLDSGSDPQFRSVAAMSVPIIQQHMSVLNRLRNMA
jgi:putative membrane protein